MVTPIFILSSPRSGSTLLQRLLLASGRCATLGEPSLLLRFLGDHEAVQRYASYRENNLSVSMQDIRKKWPGFDDNYRKGVRNMMLDIYTNLSDGKEFFVDKTPRYSLIAEEIYKTFPDAKFIVLWRHPLAIASSINKTFYKGSLRFDDFIIDLTTGLDRLHAFEQEHSDNICAIRYEDLVSESKNTLQKVGDYLGWTNLMEASDTLLPKNTGGTLGDPSGTHKYDAISRDSRDEWNRHYSNWYRRSWAKKYFDHPRSAWLEELGYTLPDAFSEGNLPLGLLQGAADLSYAVRKRKSHKKRIIRALTEHHIYPYTFKPEN